LSDYVQINTLATFFAAALLNNVVLVQSLGVSALFAFSNTRQQARELALLSFVLMSVSGSLNALLDATLLTPLGLTGIRLIVFTTVSASLAALACWQIGKHFPKSYRRNRFAILLAGANSAILGLALLNDPAGSVSLAQSTLLILGGAAGFSVLLLAFAALRERIPEQSVPLPFRGTAIQLISAGLVAMSLLVLGGVLGR